MDLKSATTPRDHKGVSKANLAGLRGQIEAINAQCAAYGIPAPVSFAYPGNAIEPGSLRYWRSSASGLRAGEARPNTRTRKATA